MEPLWSPVVASGGNQPQIGGARKPQKQAKTVAVGCDRLPESFHGKEGVDGSSPPEGSAKAAQIAAFPVEGACRSSSMRWVWSSFMELSDPKDRSERPRIRTRSRRLDEAAFQRHAD